MNIIEITYNNIPRIYIDLGIINTYNAVNGYVEKHIAYTRNEISYLFLECYYKIDEEHNTFNKDIIERVECSNINIISNNVDIPEWNKILEDKLIEKCKAVLSNN